MIRSRLHFEPEFILDKLKQNKSSKNDSRRRELGLCVILTYLSTTDLVYTISQSLIILMKESRWYTD